MCFLSLNIIFVRYIQVVANAVSFYWIVKSSLPVRMVNTWPGNGVRVPKRLTLGLVCQQAVWCGACWLVLKLLIISLEAKFRQLEEWTNGKYLEGKRIGIRGFTEDKWIEVEMDQGQDQRYSSLDGSRIDSDEILRWQWLQSRGKGCPATTSLTILSLCVSVSVFVSNFLSACLPSPPTPRYWHGLLLDQSPLPWS